MKKPIVLILLLLAGGFALPASAQYHQIGGCQPDIFISGYRSCGTPIYAKRIAVGRHYRVVPLSTCEVRWHLEQQRRIAAQRAYQRQLAYERQLARERQLRAQRAYAYQYQRPSSIRRCR